jgi:hypothetical protein
MSTRSPFFCVLPWYSKEITADSVSVCCLLEKNHDLSQIKQDLLNGIPSSYCQKCWHIENQNQDSRRLQENRLLDYKLNRNIELIEQDCRDNRNQPLMYQIYLSNLCNQACVTCDSNASTKWGELEYRNKNKKIAIRRTDLGTGDIDFGTAKRIYILGGEPLFDPAVIDLLQNLVDHNNRDCFVSFVTNGSVSISTHLRALLALFTDLNICLSIDGIGSRFEYMRWPAKWHVLLENIKAYRLVTKDNLSVSYTISGVNAIYYEETINWFQSNGLRYNHNIVTNPSWASLSRMPKQIKQTLTHPFFDDYRSITGNEVSMALFKDQLFSQDSIKQIQIQSYMPELANIMHDNP